jgi:hypothetical protein
MEPAMNYSNLQAYERDIIDNAKRFDVAIFLGVGQYDRAENLPDLATARVRASEMQAAANNGRGAMVYAISTEGRSVLVPNGYERARITVKRPRSRQR